MLVERAPRRRIFLLSGLSAVVTALTTVWTLSHTSVYDGALPPSLLLGTLGFDVTSLVASIAVAAVVVALDRGAERFWLLWLGLQAYLLYAYSLAGFAVHFDSHVLAKWNAGRMPRRTMGASLMMVAVVFAVLWILTIFGFLGDDMPQSAAIVLVLDLAFTLPLLVIVAVLLLRREPLGDFLAPGVFVMSAAITLGVAVGEFLRPAFGEPFSLVVSAPYLVPGVVCAAFSLLSFRRVSAGLAGS